MTQLAQHTTSNSWGTLTRLPAPGSDPGVLEDVPVAAVQGALALDLPPNGRRLRRDVADLRLAAPRDGEDVGPWAAQLAQAVVEVVGGDRSVGQLLRLTTTEVYEDLARRVRILARTSPAGQRLRTIRPQVRSVRVCRPTARSAEVSVHVRHGHRSRALAARLEIRDGRWLCTDLQLG